MTGRATPEWIAKHPDQAIPPRVKLRIFERHNGICHISGRRIRPGDCYDFDHIVALCNGGEHRESNLAPALKDKHREKTKEDVAIKATAARKRKKLLGIDKPKGRPVPGSRRSPWKKQYNRATGRFETVRRDQL